MSYPIKNPSLVVTSLTYTDNLGVCGPFTYNLSNADNTAYDTSVFTFDGTTPKITIYSTLVSKINTYNLKLTGTLGSWGS